MPAPALELARRWTGRALRQVLELDPISSIPRRARPPRTAPQVGLVGYYGWGNYGDELFLDVFREHFASALRLRTLVDGRSFRSVVRRLDSGVRGSDAVLIGGGDLLVPWERSARYWKPAYLRRPLFVAGRRRAPLAETGPIGRRAAGAFPQPRERQVHRSAGPGVGRVDHVDAPTIG